MKYLMTSAAALCVASSGAYAGALDRSGQSSAVLFEKGRYVEFSLSYVSPSLSGEDLAFGSGTSGDISPSYSQFAGAYKADLNDRLSYAIIIDQPFLAEVDYPLGSYFAAGSDAEFNSFALTGLLQYNMNNGMSVFGGLRLQTIDANANVQFAPFGLDYSAQADSDYGLGYVLGAAYERPEIALRVSLTYNSEISHKTRTTESVVGGVTDFVTTTELETPQSLNLEFQTGIAADTLLFGGVRWVDWSDFDLTPLIYQGATDGSLLSYEDDVYTYTLGIGRRLNETWSVAASIGYEKSSGAFFTNLGPSDGQESIGLAAIYRKDKIEITTGIRYVRIGDTQTRAGPFAPAGNFTDNDAIAIGTKIAYNF